MLIVLILANDNTQHYITMQNLWKSYMNTQKNIKSYFIKYKSEINEDILIDDNTIYVKGYESYIPGCLDKTIKSIEFLLNQNINFNFIFWTNLSSVINLEKLYNILNDNINCAGVIGTIGNNSFISGAGILLNKNTCYDLIQNKDTLNYNILDDVSIGEFLRKKKYDLLPLTRFEAYNYQFNIDLITKEMLNNYYHFRCKSDNQHFLTIKLMKKKCIV